MSLLLFWQAASQPPVTGTATWEQAAATWSATLTERITATATFAQTSTWDATASERFTSTASFVQAAATWDAAALERLTATAEWVQGAASWDATLSERIAATASFDQSASWDATASESMRATAAWAQDATWSATGNAANPQPTFTGAWEQAPAEWSATAYTPPPEQPAPSGGSANRYVNWNVPNKIHRPRPKPRIPVVVASATFSQAPAAWQAEMTVVEPQGWLLGIGETDESVLALV